MERSAQKIMKDKFISGEFYSNCLIEVIKAKMRNKNVTIYFCKPRITENGRFQMCHFMWSDGVADYDFSDREEHNLKWYQCLWFKGAIRQFEYGFGKRYSDFRNENVNLRRNGEKALKEHENNE